MECDKCNKEFSCHDEQACLECKNYGRYDMAGIDVALCPSCNTWDNRSLTVGQVIEELKKYNSDWPIKIVCRHHKDGDQVGQLINIHKITNREGGHWNGIASEVMLYEETQYIENTSEEND